MIEIIQTAIVSKETKKNLVQKNDQIKDNPKFVQFNIRGQLKWWIEKKNGHTTVENNNYSTENNETEIISQLKRSEKNKCKTCGKVTRANLPYCSTDCTYWPHLRKIN